MYILLLYVLKTEILLYKTSDIKYCTFSESISHTHIYIYIEWADTAASLVILIPEVSLSNLGLATL